MLFFELELVESLIFFKSLMYKENVKMSNRFLILLLFSVSFEYSVDFSQREILLIVKYSSTENTSMLVFLPKRL